jgi:hypothetical protein
LTGVHLAATVQLAARWMVVNCTGNGVVEAALVRASAAAVVCSIVQSPAAVAVPSTGPVAAAAA